MCCYDYCLWHFLVFQAGWVNAGSSIATMRIPGNFETYIELKDLQIDNYRPFIRFSCSVDCRINPATNNLARNDDCFLRFTLIRDGSFTIRDVDCIRYGRHHHRNGTKMDHYYQILRPGSYTMRFVHAIFSLLSPVIDLKSYPEIQLFSL